MPVEVERRCGPRVPVKLYGLGCLLDMDGHTAGDVFTIDLRDVGSGGIRLDSRRRMRPGQTVHLICRLGEFRAVPVVASVVWNRPADGSEEVADQVGLRFTSLQEAGTGKLIAYCQARAGGEARPASSSPAPEFTPPQPMPGPPPDM